MNTRLSLVMLGVSGACLGGVARYRRRQGGEEVRGQPRFTRERLERLASDQFIYGHDDEPDFNDDHTSSFSSDRFSEEFNAQFSNGFESPRNENSENSYVSDSANEHDGFLNSFIANNMNNFSQYEEPLPQPQAQTQPVPPPQSSSGQVVTEQSSEGDTGEPSLREFTLLVSKLLFHLSQM